jgi:hypothetical protein
MDTMRKAGFESVLRQQKRHAVCNNNYRAIIAESQQKHVDIVCANTYNNRWPNYALLLSLIIRGVKYA